MYSLFKVTDKLICHFYILNYFAFPFKFYISELDFVRSHPSANTETAHHKEKVLQSVHHWSWWQAPNFYVPSFLNRYIQQMCHRTSRNQPYTVSMLAPDTLLIKQVCPTAIENIWGMSSNSRTFILISSDSSAGVEKKGGATSLVPVIAHNQSMRTWVHYIDKLCLLFS